MAQGQEANGAKLVFFFDLLYNNCMLSVLIRIASILMSTHNIQFHDKLRTFT